MFILCLTYVYPMARVKIPPGSTFEQTAAELASIGITMGQRLRDGTYRAYVRKENMALFMNHINLQSL